MHTIRFFAGLVLLGVTQCRPNVGTSTEEVQPTVGARLNQPRTHTPNGAELERQQCEERLSDVLAAPAMPGATLFEANRLEILTQAKALPMLLVDTPEHSDEEARSAQGDGDISAAVKSFRKLLRETAHPWDALKLLLPNFEEFPQNGRDTLLRDGYLFADDPELAFALVNLVKARHLFGQERIWIRRGEDLYYAERRRGSYYFVDGPNAGEQVRLLLLDRIGHGPPPTHTLLRDVRALRYRLHFSRAEIRHITEDSIVANLRYGKVSVPTVLRSSGTNLSVECEVLGQELREEVAILRQEAERRQRVVQALRQSMLAQIDEQLPFDEPRREYGLQLDGRLRSNWLHAYMSGEASYAFSGTRYEVFDAKGRPLVPQVCVDFLTDTLERTSGTWFRGRNEEPGRSVGSLDYNPIDMLERAKLRRVPGFLEFARTHPEQFEVLDVPKSERVMLGNRKEFLANLLTHREDYQPGDMLIIRGFTPWDPKEMHYHSFFVYESDPLSGIPLAVVGNAGRPSVRYWEVEARRTPEREIWHRVRPTTRWLESILPEDANIPKTPFPISPRGNAGADW
jgi:hypothetical protein